MTGENYTSAYELFRTTSLCCSKRFRRATYPKRGSLQLHYDIYRAIPKLNEMFSKEQ